LNEFLSALVMDIEFEGRVADRDLLITTASIEATIPFRGKNEKGLWPCDILRTRVVRTNQAFGLRLDEQEIDDAVRSAVTFANRDVRNFAEDDVGRFLDNTWKLLPETNPSLRMSGVYSIVNYRIALQKMEGFLRFLDPQAIFSRFKDVPEEDEYNNLLKLAYRNVEVARDYLGIKLLTAAVLEALARLTGGDAPVSFFMGDINPRETGDRIEDYLPEFSPKKGVRTNETLYNLLAFGRAGASSFDLQNSPLSLFIYSELGSDGYALRLEAAKEMFKGGLNSKDFLDGFPGNLVSAVANACGEMAFTRKEALARQFQPE
ncbi:MAG: hypothetical protein JW852_10375, partial [Spirochaetales bacterium]|nr:hypothetical protein [Spirochaetales bacterium]